jgi:hypothetical protein
MCPIIVVNEAPLSNILNNPTTTGHVSLWGIELPPRHHVQKTKSYQVADFARFHSRVARIEKHRSP